MTTPTIFSNEFGTGLSSLLQAPYGQGHTGDLVRASVTVPAATAADTVIGLIPFTKGFTMFYNSVLLCQDLDSGTNVNLDWGYAYLDDVTYSEDLDGYVNGSSILQSSGLLEPQSIQAADFVAEDDGWIVAVIKDAPTTTEGIIRINAIVAYGVE